MKQYSFLNEIFIPITMDISNVGGPIGGIIGGVSPLALCYLYFKLIKQPRIKKDFKNNLERLSTSQLNKEIEWVVNVYSKLLSSDKVAPKLIEKVTEVVQLGNQILNSKSDDDTKRVYLYDVTFKYHLVSEISYRVLSKYDRKLSNSASLWIIISSCLGASVGSIIGARLYN